MFLADSAPLLTTEVSLAGDMSHFGQPLNEEDTELFDIAERLALDMHLLRRFTANLLKESGCKQSSNTLITNLEGGKYQSVPEKTYAVIKYW